MHSRMHRRGMLLRGLVPQLGEGRLYRQRARIQKSEGRRRWEYSDRCLWNDLVRTQGRVRIRECA